MSLTPRRRLPARARTLTAFALGLGAAAATPAVATAATMPAATMPAATTPDEAVRSELGAPGAAEPIAGIRPEALVTTGTVLALVMGATAAGTAWRSRRRHD